MLKQFSDQPYTSSIVSQNHKNTDNYKALVLLPEFRNKQFYTKSNASDIMNLLELFCSAEFSLLKVMNNYVTLSQS